ncbi:MAG: mechanosensitive ion channel family protein [Bacteroidetes bacterium]|nr:MAG: mechanosensitive ion channel family protein [Bacteroidota bacterium]
MQELLENEIFRTSLTTLLVIVGIFFLVRVAQRLIGRYGTDPDRIYATSRSIRRLGVFLGISAVILLFSGQIGDILTVLTLIGAGMAIALSQVLMSVAGWMRITMLTSYSQGDRIEINGVRGDVVDIRMLRTTLLEIGGWVDGDQSTGRIVHIPNSWVYLHAVYNYTRTFNFIWNELSYTLTFKSNWEAARDIITEFANESAAIVEKQARSQIKQLSGEFLIHYSVMTPFVYVSVATDGVKLTLRYLCEVRKRRGSSHALNVSILAAFQDRDDIEFAFRTMSLHQLPEGVPGTGPQGAV